mmetsp:Transcript_4544/g.19366  ORF Transcript_4544/g.19366 Transcript_4544/m.19366 type:complete len:218 (+) Transcript_4544:163-816(+)
MGTGFAPPPPAPPYTRAMAAARGSRGFTATPLLRAPPGPAPFPLPGNPNASAEPSASVKNACSSESRREVSSSLSSSAVRCSISSSCFEPRSASFSDSSRRQFSIWRSRSSSARATRDARSALFMPMNWGSMGTPPISSSSRLRRERGAEASSGAARARPRPPPPPRRSPPGPPRPGRGSASSGDDPLAYAPCSASSCPPAPARASSKVMRSRPGIW